MSSSSSSSSCQRCSCRSWPSLPLSPVSMVVARRVGFGSPQQWVRKRSFSSAIIEGFRSIVNQKNSYGCEQESQDLI
jgi:hypothetical protein